MSINRTCLHAFHIVASEGSFSRAALTHYVSQPTLSAQVKELESRYNVNLLERHGNGVSPTNIGRSLYEITQQMFSLEVEAEKLLFAAHSKTTGQLRIGADSPYLIIPLMAMFQNIYPDVRLHIEFGNSRQLLEAILARRYDLAVLPGIKPTEKIHSIPLQADRLIAFVNVEHSWSKKQSIRLTDLAQQNIVLREIGSNTRSRFETIVKKRAITLRENNVITIGSREGVCEAVAAGLGVGIVSMSEFGHDKRLHPLTIRDVKTKHSEYIACLQKRKNDLVIKAFLDSIPMKKSV